MWSWDCVVFFFPLPWKKLFPHLPPVMTIKSILMPDGILLPRVYHSIYLSFVPSEHFVHNSKQRVSIFCLEFTHNKGLVLSLLRVAFIKKLYFLLPIPWKQNSFKKQTNKKKSKVSAGFVSTSNLTLKLHSD